jgi:hypothetical protein
LKRCKFYFNQAKREKNQAIKSVKKLIARGVVDLNTAPAKTFSAPAVLWLLFYQFFNLILDDLNFDNSEKEQKKLIYLKIGVRHVHHWVCAGSPS